MSTSSGIELSYHGAVARVLLKQPGKLNAMSRAMWRELREVFQERIRVDSTRCVLVSGDGRQFCAGGDISEYPAFRFNPASLHDFHEHDVWGALRAMQDCDVPIVARIEGYCIGAGLEIAACCDLRVASDTARFGAPIAHLGFPMAPRETQLILRELGATTAREMLLSASILDARTLFERGFLTHVVSSDAIDERVNAVLDRVLQLAPQAARLNKQALRALHAPCTTAQAWLDASDHRLRWHPAYGYADSAEHQEGIAAFLQKRKPVFE